MSSSLDARVSAAEGEWNKARTALVDVLDERVAVRIRQHFAAATELSIDVERTDDGDGWSVSITEVLDAGGNDLLRNQGYLAEVIDEDAAQAIERDLEWICDIDTNVLSDSYPLRPKDVV